jgi:hypothetical protein
VGKYGTNLEGFGAFEGGVNADKGAPLISTSSDGETALLFGPAALREIQAGVANGDFAIPPDEADATITAENPLPYWTFTDVNSNGAITCAIVADSTAPSGFALQWSVLAGTTTGKSATISRNVAVIPGTGTPTTPNFYSVAHQANYSYTGVGTADLAINLKIKYEYYDSGDTDLTTTPPESSAATFTGSGTSGGDATSGVTSSTLAPVNAAYAKITITCTTTGTVGGSVGTFRQHNIHNVRFYRQPLGMSVPGLTAGGADSPVSIWSDTNTLTVNGNVAAANGYVYFEFPTGATPKSIGLIGTNLRLLSSGATAPADLAASITGSRAGVLVTKSLAGQPTTTVNGTGTSDAFADAVRNGALALDNGNSRFYVYSQGAWRYAALTNPSDSRLKEEITEISGALDTLRQLVPVAFKWKAAGLHKRTDSVDDDGTRLGFIADQVATTDLKHWVETMNISGEEAEIATGSTDETSVLAVNIPQNEMEALLVQALLDIDTRLKALESR